MNDLWSLTPRTRRALTIAEMLGALVLTALSCAAVAGSGRMSWYGLASAMLIFVAYVLRRRHLSWSVAAALAAGILQVVDPHGFLFFADLLYAPVCSRLGSHRAPQVRRRGLALTALSIVLPCVFLVPRIVTDRENWYALIGIDLMFACATALVTVGGWTWGYLRLQQRLRVEAAIAAQLSEAERSRLEETYAQSAFRQRIAAEMHDVVGHSWAVVAAQADGARYALRTSPETAERALETIAEIARTSITELRDILRELRYTETREGQAGAAQQDELLHRMRQTGMNLEFTESGQGPPSGPLRFTAHRVLSEALTNALKHGDLTHPVKAHVSWQDGCTIDVENRIAHTSHLPGSGLGLASMHERVRIAGGDLDAQPNGDFWILRAVLPAAPLPATPLEKP